MSIFDEVYNANMNSGNERKPDNKGLKPVSVRNISHIHTHLKINLIRPMYNSPDMYHHSLSLRLLALSLFKKRRKEKLLEAAVMASYSNVTLITREGTSKQMG